MNQEYNLTVQTQFPGKVSGQIGYVGARGTHTFQYYPDWEAPIPDGPTQPSRMECWVTCRLDPQAITLYKPNWSATLARG